MISTVMNVTHFIVMNVKSFKHQHQSNKKSTNLLYFETMNAPIRPDSPRSFAVATFLPAPDGTAYAYSAWVLGHMTAIVAPVGRPLTALAPDAPAMLTSVWGRLWPTLCPTHAIEQAFFAAYFSG